MGYNGVSFNGQTKYRTPNIDRIAHEGMIFTNHYAGSTVCGPSRAALLSGSHTGHNAIRENRSWMSTEEQVPFPNHDENIALRLQRAGYQTAIIGKWGLADWGPTYQANRQGFDYFYGYKGHGDAHHYYPEYLWRNEEKVRLEGNVPSKKIGQYTSDLFAAESLQFLEKASRFDHPFFLYLAFTIPHLELTVPAESKAPFLNLGWDKYPMEFGKYYNDEEGNTTYAGMIARMDDQVGQVLKKLADLGLDDNTLVVFTSDNGAEYKSPFFENNKPLRGRKRDLYEGGIRIPFAARWPGHIEAGSVTDHVSAFWDFPPTACELAGIDVPKDIDGISYLPTLLGKDAQQKKHDYLYWEFNENGGPKQAIRQGNWKFVKLWNKEPELYDLSKDIGEQHNLAGQHPDMVKKCARLLTTARTDDPNYLLVPTKYGRKK